MLPIQVGYQMISLFVKKDFLKTDIEAGDLRHIQYKIGLALEARGDVWNHNFYYISHKQWT